MVTNKISARGHPVFAMGVQKVLAAEAEHEHVIDLLARTAP